MRARLAFVFWLTFTAQAAAQQPADPAGAEGEAYATAIARAVQEFEFGHYAEARAAFRAAHELSPSARTLRGLGQSEFELRNYRESIALLRQALASKERPLGPALRQDALSLLHRAEAYVARYRLDLEPADARVLVDGVAPADGADCPEAEVACQDAGGSHPTDLVLEVGDHVVLVRAEGYEDAQRELRVTGRTDAVLHIRLRPLSDASGEGPGFWRSGWTWTAIGAGVVAIAATTIALSLDGGERTRPTEASTIPEWDGISATRTGAVQW